MFCYKASCLTLPGLPMDYHPQNNCVHKCNFKRNICTSTARSFRTMSPNAFTAGQCAFPLARLNAFTDRTNSYRTVSY